MTQVEIFRVFSIIDGSTIKRLSSEDAACKMCDENEEYDYEVIFEYY